MTRLYRIDYATVSPDGEYDATYTEAHTTLVDALNEAALEVAAFPVGTIVHSAWVYSAEWTDATNEAMPIGPMIGTFHVSIGRDIEALANELRTDRAQWIGGAR
jgi:hypothetical protein